MANPVQGFYSKLGIGSASPVTVPLDFVSESLVLTEEFKDRGGLRGTRSHNIENMRAGLRRVDGSLVLQPTAVELANIMAWILGGTPVGTSYPLGETLSSKYVAIDRSDGTDGKVFEYSGCVVSRATFRSSPGELLEVTLDLVGVDETVGNAGTFPSLTLDTTTAPFIFHDLALSVGGTSYSTRDIEIVIDNRVDGERFFNSQTRTAAPAQDREISISLNLPYGEAEAAYNTGIGGAAVTATFTNGTVSVLFSFVKVVFPRRSPNVPGKTEIMLPLVGMAKKSGSTAELAVTLDSTP